MSRLRFLTACLLTLGCASHRAQNGVAVTYDGEEVSLAVFEAELARQAPVDPSLADSLRLSFASTMLNKLIMAGEARRTVLPGTPEGELEEVRRRTLIARHREAIGDTLDFSPERMTVMFGLIENRVRIRQIVRATRAEADSVVTALARGADFSELARRTSIDTTSAAAGGEVEWVHFGMMAGVDELALGLEEGAVGGPVRTFRGWHIVRVEEREPRPNRSWIEQARHLFDQGFPTHLRRERWREWWSTALERHGVRLHEADLSTLVASVLTGDLDVPRAAPVAAGPGFRFTIGDGLDTWEAATEDMAPLAYDTDAVRYWFVSRLRDRLVEREAVAAGLLDREEVRRALDDAVELHLVEALYARQVLAHVLPDTAALRRYHASSPGTLARRPALDVLACRADGQATTEAAHAILASVDSGAAAIEVLQTRVPDAEISRAWIQPSDDAFPQLAAALRRLPLRAGETLAPRRLDGKWITARIEEVGEAVPLTFEEALASGMLERWFTAEMTARRTTVYLDSLRATRHAAIDTSVVLRARVPLAVRDGDAAE